MHCIVKQFNLQYHHIKSFIRLHNVIRFLLCLHFCFSFLKKLLLHREYSDDLGGLQVCQANKPSLGDNDCIYFVVVRFDKGVCTKK